MCGVSQHDELQHSNAPEQLLGPLIRAKSIARQFEVTAEQLHRATRHFVRQLNEGLDKDGTDLLQIPSYVTRLPDGTEKGRCLAIDFGGTNLRVLSIDLHGDSTHSATQSKIAIPPFLMSSKNYEDLFGFIASHTEKFMMENFPDSVQEWRNLLRENGGLTTKLQCQHCHRLGFAFSFTFDQHSINTGTLMFWTKSFCIEDAVGRDPAWMLQEALNKQELPILVSALANDTVGALAARAYASPGKSNTLLGAIFGTGTNGAYLEQLINIKKLHSRPEYSDPRPGEYMALNTEWGGFDKKLAVLPVTIYDAGLDRDSVNPGDQHYEKRISGLYLGELLRRVILTEMEMEPGNWNMKLPPDSNLYVPNSVDSSFLSALVQDRSLHLDSAKAKIATTLGASSISEGDAKVIRILADAIGSRAARLSAIAIAGVVIQSGRLSRVGGVSALTSLSPNKASGIRRTAFSIVRKSIGLLSRLTALCQAMGCIRSQSAPVEPTHPAAKTRPAEEPSPEDIIDIGVDGSLFQYFPGFEDKIRGALRELPDIGLQGERRIRMGMALDGSGAGTALIAWSAEHTKGV
ncbi:Fc.00g010280.m01.CDS01 [Cosmosporella sp. VM-42]